MNNIPYMKDHYIDIPESPDSPCELCICVPICRNKTYIKLFQDCGNIRLYEPSHNKPIQRDKYRIQAIEKHLNPSIWSIRYIDKYKLHMIVNKTYNEIEDGPMDWTELVKRVNRVI